MSKMKSKKFFSLRAKYMLLLTGVLSFLIAGLWLANRYLLEKYYQQKQLDNLAQLRSQVEAYVNGGLKETEEMSLRQSCEQTGVRLMIAREGGFAPVTVFSNADNEGGPASRLFNGFGELPPDVREQNIYEETDSYSVYRVSDSRTSTDQLECIGRLAVTATVEDSLTEEDSEEGEYIYVLTISLANIREASGIANRFLLLMGLCALVLGGGLVAYVTWKITKPIASLSELSREMTELHFEKRYNGHSHDELQQLGENMNHMAGSLETAIVELREANSRLEADIQEKELNEKSRSEFLSNLSHEFKTPLALIEGYAEGLRDGISEDPDSRTYYCEVILDEASKMNRLVRQIINLNELEAGRMKTDISAFDFAEMLQAEAEPYRLKAEEKQAQLIIELPDSLPVVSDEFLLEQVAQNYISNALHHVSEKGKILVRAARKGENVLFTVYNTGDRIPEASLDALWDKFYKVDKARTRAYGGSGIGLSVVKASLSCLGGSCSVRNLEDGVEFAAVFPGTAPMEET